MKMKTSELIEEALDWAVTKALGLDTTFNEDFGWIELSPSGECHTAIPSYSTDWTQGGPLIEEARIALLPSRDVWVARIQNPAYKLGDWLQFTGPTPLIAAMRAYVASKLGAEIELPQELT